MWDKLASNLIAARDRFVPTHCASRKPSWKAKPGSYTPDAETRKLIREKARTHNLYREHRNQPDADEYRASFTRARNHVRTVLRKKKRLFEKQIATEAKDCPKKFYAYCGSKTRTKAGIAPLLSDPHNKDSLVFSDADKSEVLQQQYCSVFTEEGAEELPSFNTRCNSKLSSIKVDISKLKKKLEGLNSAKAAGPDGLHPRLLKECADVIAEPLAHLYQASLDSGMVPKEWKKSVVAPIFKKGARAVAANYRPVSLTAILCKLLEDIIRSAINDHLTEHNLLTARQFGFMKGRSTSLQLLTYLDEVAARLAEGGTVDAIYLDYQKAFETVPHRRLLLKLEAYGITGAALSWIESFLTGRTQRVAVNGTLSEERAVLSGVPQGSVLGPILFLVFINDIVDDLETNIFLFADDSKLFNQIRSYDDMAAVQRDLVKLEAWSDRWLLRFHPGKCHVLTLGGLDTLSKQTDADGQPVILWHVDYKLCGQNLEHVEQERDLGVIIDGDLTFRAHIDSKVNTANAFLGLIRRNFQYLDLESLLRLFKAFVRPHLEYAAVVWSPSLQHRNYRSLVNRIEQVQMRALNLVPELQGLSYAEQLTRARLPTLAYRRFRGDLIEVFKHYKTYDKRAISASFKPNPRHPDKLRQSHATPLQARLFYHRVQEWWNSLPTPCRDTSVTVDTFKCRFDKHWATTKLPLLRDHLGGPPTRSNDDYTMGRLEAAFFC